MSEVSDLSEVIDDGILGEPFTINRSTGVFSLGGYVITPVSIAAYGVVSVARDEDLREIPEADRVTGAMVFHTSTRIYLTQQDADGTQHISDIVLWNYQLYRIIHVGPYPNRTYWKALGVRIQGN